MDDKQPKYAHWYCHNDSCCDGKDMMCDEDIMMCEKPMPYKVKMYPTESLMDRLLCLLGNKVILSVDAPLFKKKRTFCGILCFVGCDFVVLSICSRKRPLTLHIPICMIRYITPY